MVSATQSAADLDNACRAAASRADGFHQDLRPLLRESGAVIAAYTFKDRVKPWHSVREKVVRKRNEGKKSILPSSIKDISGFRIVSLFNQDIPRALDSFFDILTAQNKMGLALSNIAEIELHTNRLTNDPLSIAKEVEALVARHSLDRIYEGKPPSVGFSSYSSLHVIISQEINDNGDRYWAYSEIQFRSVFEEAWSEISHRLGYGPEKREKAEGLLKTGAAPAPADLRWKPHLDALKSLVDGCAQYADLIAHDAGWRGGFDSKRIAPESIDPSEGGWRGFFQSAPVSLFPRLETAFSERDQAEAAAGADGDNSPHAAEIFKSAGEKFLSILEDAQNDEGLTSSQVNGIRSEAAFCLMHSGNRELVTQAERLWRDVLKVDRSFAPAYLRLGQIRLRAGEFSESRELLENAEKFALGIGSADEKNKRLFVIRRGLGVALWRLAEGSKDLNDQADLLRASADVSKRAIEVAGTNALKRIAICNALYVLVELYDKSNASNSALYAEIQELDDVLQLLDGYGKWQDKSWSVWTLDSLVRAEKLLGRDENVRSLALEILARYRAQFEEQAKRESVSVNMRSNFLSLSNDDQDIYLTASEILGSMGRPSEGSTK